MSRLPYLSTWKTLPAVCVAAKVRASPQLSAARARAVPWNGGSLDARILAGGFPYAGSTVGRARPWAGRVQSGRLSTRLAARGICCPRRCRCCSPNEVWQVWFVDSCVRLRCEAHVSELKSRAEAEARGIRLVRLHRPSATQRAHQPDETGTVFQVARRIPCFFFWKSRSLFSTLDHRILITIKLT